MLNERNPLTIMPEDFYHNTLRPELYEVLSKVKFDPVLTLTIEETINKQILLLLIKNINN